MVDASIERLYRIRMADLLRLGEENIASLVPYHWSAQIRAQKSAPRCARGAL